MSIHHPKSVEAVSLLADDARPSGQIITLVKTDKLEVLRFEVPLGKEIATRAVAGPVTVQCLEGRVLVLVRGQDHELCAGQFLYLENDPYSVRGIEDSFVLITILLNPKDVSVPFDVVQEASEESFPASDPPAY